MARMKAYPKATIDVRARRRLQRQQQRERLTAAVSRDPKTGLLRRGRIGGTNDRLTIRLPKRLESPNRWLWVHWQIKARAKRAWAKAIALAACDSLSRPTVAAFETPAAALGWATPDERVRVTVRREVARRTHFISDDDNLAFAGKGLMDCLVQAGFLRDDSRTAIDLHVEQDVSADGLPWTVIDIAPLAAPQGATHAE